MGMSAGRVKQMADILNGKAQPLAIRREAKEKQAQRKEMTKTEQKGA